MNKHPQWPEDYQDWTGSIEDLVQEAARILNQIDPKLGSPTTSLVRYYQQQGAVGRGQKKGRASSFGYEDLARVVATKQMASQQVPLALSKHMFSTTPVDSIVRSAGMPGDIHYGSPAAAASVALSNKTHTANEAERTVAQLLSGASYADRSFMGNQSNVSAPLKANFAVHTAAACMTPTANTLMSVGPKALPAGGVLRYTLATDVSVEIPADTQDRSAQAQALREFANQIDPSFQPPTWRIP